MKPIQTPDNDEHLRAVLRGWVVDTPLPPRFQDQVWQRITRTEIRLQPGFWGSLIRLVEVALPRPKIALSYVATLLVLGVAAGSMTAQVRSSHVNADLGARYVQSLDPYRADTSQP
jgi:hypothetical protein